MSSFLFEKEDYYCSCFDNSPKQDGRIFITQSYPAPNNNKKENMQISERNENQQGKYKKKSLKKEMPVSFRGSEFNLKKKQQPNGDVCIEQIPIGAHNLHNKKEKIIIGFDYIEVINYQNLRSQRGKPAKSLRSIQKYSTVFQKPIVFQKAHQMDLKIPISKIYKQNLISQKEYDQIIKGQFQKDYLDFKHHMQNKQRQQDTKIYIRPQTQRQKRQEENKKQYNRNQYVQIHKLTLQNLQNEKKILHHLIGSKISTSEINERTSVRPSSFRNSAVSHKQKQFISIKIKGKMLPKQIESEKDGSDTDSNKMSEVVGRGWDQFTQQRIEFQQLEQIIKEEKFNTETTVTQYSHIKNSEIKTLTDYSNSFISPKSQQTKNASFGGGHKYGTIGMSYQNIDELGKTKIHYKNKLPF